MRFSGWGLVGGGEDTGVRAGLSGGNSVGPSCPPVPRRRAPAGRRACRSNQLLPSLRLPRAGPGKAGSPGWKHQSRVLNSSEEKKRKNLVISLIILRKVTVTKERWVKLKLNQAVRNGE